MLAYGVFGFRPGLRRGQQPPGRASVGWKEVVWRWVWLGFWLRRRREMWVATRSGIVNASVIMAGSAQAARRNAGEPWRVMARWSR